MANKDLFKQAIADAKSIREAAIANAKLALEESLTPQLKELLAQRLAEMEEEEAPAAVISEEEVTEEVAEEALEEAYGPDGLEEVEAEEAEEEGAEGEEEAGEEAGEEAEDDSEKSEDEAEEEEVGEMSVDDLKDLIRDVLMQVMGDQEEGREDDLKADAEDMGGEDMMAADADAEISIDELMAELATIGTINNPGHHGNLEEVEQIDELAEAAIKAVMEGLKETTHKYLRAMAEARGCSMEELVKEATRMGALTEMSKVSGVLNGMAELGEAAFMEAVDRLIPEKVAAPAMEEEVLGENAYMDFITFAAQHPEAVVAGVPALLGSLIAIAKGGTMAIKKLASQGGKIGKIAQDFINKGQAVAGAASQGIKEESSDETLAEALSTIETLQNELNETNLLNAKLLYVNKVFKANNLTEGQKANIIAAFDKAETVKEVKLVYETVSENVTAGGKKEVVKEAKGFASAAAGMSTKPGVITEANAAVLRMQKLAGIIK